MSNKVELEIIEKDEKKSVTFNNEVEVTVIPNREENKKLQAMREYEELKNIYGDDLAKSQKEQQEILNKIIRKNEMDKQRHWEQIHRNRIEQANIMRMEKIRKQQENIVAQKQHYLNLQQQRFNQQKQQTQHLERQQTHVPRQQYYKQYIKPRPVQSQQKRAGSGLLFTR